MATTAQQVLRDALRTIVAPVLREAGFKGTAPTWVRTNDRGDKAVVNVQRSDMSTAQELWCIVNLAVVPEPWLAHVFDDRGQPVPKAVKEYHGLLQSRLTASANVEHRDRGGEVWWVVRDERSAIPAARDMAAQLTSEGLPRLDSQLDRAALLDSLRQGRLGGITAEQNPAYVARVLAVLLADEGPSDELDRAIARVREVGRAEHVPEVVRWVERRAALRAQAADA